METADRQRTLDKVRRIANVHVRVVRGNCGDRHESASELRDWTVPNVTSDQASPMGRLDGSEVLVPRRGLAPGCPNRVGWRWWPRQWAVPMWAVARRPKRCRRRLGGRLLRASGSRALARRIVATGCWPSPVQYACACHKQLCMVGRQHMRSPGHGPEWQPQARFFGGCCVATATPDEL